MKLFIDLETIPDQSPDALKNAREQVKVPANYKKPEAIEKYRDEHAVETWQKTALAGISGEICSIAWAVNDEPVRVNTRHIHAETEAELIFGFFNEIRILIRNGEGTYPNMEWIGHNVIDFDLRFLLQRAIIHSIKPKFRIPADARHGQNVFDTMKAWAGWKGYVKQSELQKAFDIDINDELAIKDGSQVADAWFERRYGDISDYNADDVRVNREIYKRLTWTV